MLKKAGMVVLGATAGMLSLAPLANAGEMPSGGGDHGHHGHHGDHGGHGHGWGHDRGRGDCGDVAFSGGRSLVDLSNLAANADVNDINVLSHDEGDDDGCRGGGHGGRGRDGGDVAYSRGGSLINASNALSNADISDINVLSNDED